MSYFLHQKPDTHCPIKEREDMLDAILTAAQDDKELFARIEQEIYTRCPEKMTSLHHRAFNGVDIRRGIDKLFEDVVEEMMNEDETVFGGGE